jgi:hypothetical protein
MGITNLDIHTGKTKKWRIQAAAPTTPTVEIADVYIDSSTGSEALAIYSISGWLYLSLQV